MDKAKFFRIYLVPGIIFQSVLIGGGYGTGREIVEYFGSYGAGGLWGLIVTFIFFAVVLCLTFEFARMARAYDYRSWIRGMLGPAWPLYDILYFFMAILVIAVITAAAASIMYEQAGIPFFLAAAIVIIIVGILMFYGRRTIENYKTIITIGLYLVFLSLFITVLGQKTPEISATIAEGAIEPGWAQSGFIYAMYNLVCVVPVLWFCDVFETRKHAIISGIVASVLAIIPALLTLLSTLAFYPDILPVEVPWTHIIRELGLVFLLYVYFVVIALTLVETSTGMAIGFIQRINGHLADLNKPQLSARQRSLGSVLVLVAAMLLAQVGIIDLIAVGYTYMGYGFLVLHALPVVTIGLYKIIQNKPINSR